MPSYDDLSRDPNHDAPALRFQPALRHYILAELAAAPPRHLGLDTPLFESLLDSTSVLALVGYLESEFQIEIADSEVVPGNFSTLRRLGDFLERKTRPTVTPRAAAGY